MEKFLAGLLMVLFLLVGAVGGHLMTGEKIVDNLVEVEVEKLVNVEVPVEVEVLVADATAYKDQAIDDFMNYVDDEELFMCDDYEYNLDEISIVRVYDRWNLELDDEYYTVKFDIKLEYDEDDERSCKTRYAVEAHYEDDKDVEISVD